MTLSLSLALSLLPAARADDVVVFGDSWAEGAADELEDVLRTNGRADLTVDGQGVGGTTADLWATTYPTALPDAVGLNPDARWVWLSIGGNDLFQHYLEGRGGSTAADYEADLRVMLDNLFAAHPDVEVVMFGYDFINFEQSNECILTAWAYFGTTITTPTLNGYFIDEIMGTIEAVAADYPRLTYVDSVLGTLQAAGGVAGAPNSLLPSPSRYMSDCIHPNHEGYLLIMQALYDDYWGRPAPSASMSPEGGAVCVGEAETFLGLSADSAAQHWYLDGAFVQESDQLELSFEAAGTHSLTLEARSGAWTDSVTAVVEVAEAPVAQAGEDLSLCEGEAALLGTAPEGGVSYAWSPSAGLDDPSSPQPLASPSETTTYTLVATSGGACSDVDEVLVTVLPAETLELDGPEAADVGEAVTFVAAAAAPVRWEVEGATPELSADGLEATVTWAQAGDWRVSAFAEPGEGCPGEASLAVQVFGEGGDSGVDTGAEGKEGSCGCAGAPGPTAGWGLSLLGVLLLRRRRS